MRLRQGVDPALPGKRRPRGPFQQARVVSDALNLALGVTERHGGSVLLSDANGEGRLGLRVNGAGPDLSLMRADGRVFWSAGKTR